MKFFGFTVFMCALAASVFAGNPKEEFEKQLTANQETCVKETGVTPELAAKSMKGEFANDSKLDCYLKCMFVKTGYMAEDGRVNAEYMKEHPRPDIDVNKAAAIVDKCKTPEGANPCEKARTLANCVNDSLK